MDLHLKDKVVVITGGGKGIGAAIARAVAQEGAIPGIVDRDAEAAQKLQIELREAGRPSEIVVADLAATEACARIVAQVQEKLGRIDALINNAGINDRVGLETGAPEKFVASLERNLLHYYNMAHHALPHLKRAQGCILNISSKTAVTGQGGTSGYVAAKGAILALTREWACELLAYGIRVNAIVPAEVMTPLYLQWANNFPSPREKIASVANKIPLGHRLTEPDEIAAAAAFLISDRANHITAQHIFVDGGYTHLDRALT